LVAETKRKSLPRLAQATKADPQALHHFLAKADWSMEALRAMRLELTRQALHEWPFILCIDETGDRKKGKTTDYTAHQYIGNVHTLTNGVVSVNAYGVLDSVAFPLAYRLYKPRRRLKPGDVYKSKLRLAVELIQELAAQGFHSFQSLEPVRDLRLMGGRMRVCQALAHPTHPMSATKNGASSRRT
jgi:SRSO17 transposase